MTSRLPYLVAYRRLKKLIELDNTDIENAVHRGDTAAETNIKKTKKRHVLALDELEDMPKYTGVDWRGLCKRHGFRN